MASVFYSWVSLYNLISPEKKQDNKACYIPLYMLYILDKYLSVPSLKLRRLHIDLLCYKIMFSLVRVDLGDSLL